ncbi:sensor histidine kinase [Subtercola lobariae]|uniref:Two-component sensor histidine kinase n=1 Tax=Subtercola lobariae TaxID=1588641 RepID=A0A917B4S2_9MICO|nr:sensor histidine kinase [Subtercola lobariae]GGF20451.1 two-component sensor histidine kinase [Subtercola lobariae]
MWGRWIEALSRQNARRWYLGSLVGLVWLAFPIAVLWSGGLAFWAELLGQGLLIAWAAIYVVGPPLFWGRSARATVVAGSAFFVTTLLFIPFLGDAVTSLWVFVAIAFAMAGPSIRVVAAFAGAISLLSFAVISVVDSVDNATYLPLITFSVAMMMSAFARQLQLVRRLRDSQAENARLAVEHERGRVARDIHDILGHSLTVITVKAELAQRLIADHPERAETEVADIERLARGALADVRATVTGYRGVSLAAELSGARAALNSAGIEAELPNNIENVPGETSRLFAWVVREGVTNVIRHSGAGRCAITLEPHSIAIADDGCGGNEVEHSAWPTRGNGLNGLAERVTAAGGSMAVEVTPAGGFVLTVTA